MLLIYFYLSYFYFSVYSINDHPGHLKPFGSSGPFIPISSISEEIDAINFFANYVSLSLPLVMTGAAQISPAFNKWSDDYLSSIKDAENIFVSVEDGKVENRSAGLRQISFREFLSIYNFSDVYMVNPLPIPLEHDVVLPLSLQCKSIYEDALIENVIWMSSGDTSSVVHTDTVDNIICLYRGFKTVTLINRLFEKQVLFEHETEGYSEINVLSVNYTKYPGLSDVSYYVAHLKPGDCLYIPYKWIHQVNSVESNIAVNIWWAHHKSLYYFNLIMDGKSSDACNRYLDESLTFDKIKFLGFGSEYDYILDFKERFLQYITKNLNQDEFIDIFLQEDDVITEVEMRHFQYLEKAFVIFDQNKDNYVSMEEAHAANNENWEEVKLLVELFESKMERDQSNVKLSSNSEKNTLLSDEL